MSSKYPEHRKIKSKLLVLETWLQKVVTDMAAKTRKSQAARKAAWVIS